MLRAVSIVVRSWSFLNGAAKVTELWPLDIVPSVLASTPGTGDNGSLMRLSDAQGSASLALGSGMRDIRMKPTRSLTRLGMPERGELRFLPHPRDPNEEQSADV